MTLEDIYDGTRNWKLTKERITNLAIGILALLIYEFVARPYYRPFIYSNNINDFHIADTLGNSLGTIATVFIFIGLIGKGKNQHLFLIKTITISLVLFELSHPLLGKPTDLWDIAATILTGTTSYFLYNIFKKDEVVQGS